MKHSNRKKTISERISMSIARNPARAVLLLILEFNLIFFLIAAFLISRMAPPTLATKGFWPSVFYTITMILDAGCISYVVEDVGQTGLAIIIVCLLIVLIGMITFTGAVIGYITNYISAFIENANTGKQKLNISNHVVILNWNSRGAEAITDFLYTEQTEDVVVLVRSGKDEIQQEIENRIESTIAAENAALVQKAQEQHMSTFGVWNYMRKNRFRRAVSVIVREGDVLSTAQLSDICIDKAQTIMILGRDYTDEKNKYDGEKKEIYKRARGNSYLIKSLILVAEMTSKDESADNQKIVVEVEDDWTEEMVNQVIAHKERLGKCDIIPIPVNRNLGQLMSQLSVTPELHQVYAELFSNKDNYFTSRILNEKYEDIDEKKLFADYLRTHSRSIPMSVMKAKEGTICYYLSDHSGDVDIIDKNTNTNPPLLKLNSQYNLHKKNVIILGHNSSMKSLMNGFDAFRSEWNYADGKEILNLIVIDEPKSLNNLGYYKEYPYVSKVIPSDVYDKQAIYEAFDHISEMDGDISILILSDDQMPNEDVDEEPLAYLMYIDDIMRKRKEKDSSFCESNIDIIIEILDPQNYEAISSYNPKHIVLSNKYISHMMTQVGEHEGIANFYDDILTYDRPGVQDYTSKELYIKVAGELLMEMPAACTAHELVQALYTASPDDNKMLLIGYFHGDKYTLFTGENADMEIRLQPEDRLIMCSNH